MLIREYRISDCRETAMLFYNTVHTTNAKDYSQGQIDVWACAHMDLEQWDKSLQEHYSLVAVQEGRIIGFGDITLAGYLDRLYVHPDYQGNGIARTLCGRLEQTVLGKKITVHSSITARPFFEKQGYRMVKEQQVQRKGIFLTNYVMEKS